MTDDIFAYQTRVQGLANQLGDNIAKAIGSTDRELVNLLLREISRLPKDKAKAHKKLEWVESEISEAALPVRSGDTSTKVKNTPLFAPRRCPSPTVKLALTFAPKSQTGLPFPAIW